MLDNKFVYGSLVQCLDGSVGIFCGDDFEHHKIFAVKESTIGQFTGLTDKNGKEIYEGDIISSKNHPKIKHLIFYNEKQGKFMAGLYGKTNIYDFGVCGVDIPAWMAEKEVVGNIHDNPELLKGGKK